MESHGNYAIPTDPGSINCRCVVSDKQREIISEALKSHPQQPSDKDIKKPSE